MRVCYWNVCSSSGIDQIVDTCAQMEGVDIFCLQEVPYGQNKNGKPASYALADILGYESVFSPTRDLPISQKGYRGYGSAIVSCSNIIDYHPHVLRSDVFAYMSPAKANSRVLLTAKVKQNPELVVAVSHLSYKLPLGLGRAGLTLERESLKKQLSLLTDSSEVIFGGDLNCLPDDSLNTEIEELGFARVDVEGDTFRSRHWYAGYNKRNLDRVFHTPGLAAEVTAGDYQSSDHRPIIVDIN